MPSGVPGTLDHQVFTVHLLPQVPGLLNRALGIVR